MIRRSVYRMQRTSLGPVRTLEDALGPASRRYFGSGYKNVEHALRRETETSGGDGFHGLARLTYPPGWSQNNGLEREPHLSTIDAVVLPLMALEEQMQAGDEQTRLGTHFVSRIDLRAGDAPWLDLAAVPVSVTSIEREATSLDFIGVTGNIRARLALAPSGISSRKATVAEGRTMARSSTYTNLYRTNSSNSRLTEFDGEAGRLTASHSFETSSDEVPAPESIEGSFWPAVTVVDYLVTMGQLAQALISLRHGVARSGTLWMRRMTISVPASPVPMPADLETRTVATRDRAVDRGGRRYRDVVIDSRASNGVQVVASLALMDAS
jgi:hypothetical protein